MLRAKDMTGEVFGYLTVIRRYFPTTQEIQGALSNDRKAMWLCRCRCGGEKITTGDNLRRGHTQSCGCYQKEQAQKSQTTHGASQQAEYHAWQQAKQRCLNPKHDRFRNYGGRGIDFFPNWIDNFEQFLHDVGPKPRGRFMLDRIDNDRGYVPGNLRWTTIGISNGSRRRRHRSPTRLEGVE